MPSEGHEHLEVWGNPTHRTTLNHTSQSPLNVLLWVKTKTAEGEGEKKGLGWQSISCLNPTCTQSHPLSNVYDGHVSKGNNVELSNREKKYIGFVLV